VEIQSQYIIRGFTKAHNPTDSAAFKRGMFYRPLILGF